MIAANGGFRRLGGQKLPVSNRPNRTLAIVPEAKCLFLAQAIIFSLADREFVLDGMAPALPNTQLGFAGRQYRLWGIAFETPAHRRHNGMGVTPRSSPRRLISALKEGMPVLAVSVMDV